MNRSRQSGAHLCLRDPEIARGDLRAVDLDGQPNGLAVQARQGANDRGRGGMAVEYVAGAARDDFGPESAQNDRRLAVRDVDRGRDLVELVLQGHVVDLRRGRHIRPEEAQVEPAEPAQRPEAVALPAHCVDGCMPVHTDPEVPGLQLPGAGADPEGHRD